MAQSHSDDLFENTKMTFGEHLEELRVCLFRAVLGLVIAFLIGLFLAKYVVRAVQTPLKEALTNFYITRTLTELKEEYPTASEEELEHLRRIVSTYHLRYERAFVERTLVRRALEAPDAVRSDTDRHDTSALDEKLPFPQIEEMATVRIWRPFTARISSLNAQEAFLIWLKAAFVTGLIIASPYMFYQIWVFVSAGLYPHERRYVYVFLPISAILFWAGAALAFFGVFRYVLQFLLQFNATMDIDAEPRISEWISLVLLLPVGFGIAFQLPLVMLFLNRLGIFTVEAYLSKWKVAVLVITVMSMLLTPADPISMLMMGVPLVVLYFLGIAFCKWMPRGRNPYREAYEP